MGLLRPAEIKYQAYFDARPYDFNITAKLAMSDSNVMRLNG